MKPSPPWITGVGVITGLGLGIEATWKRLVAGATGIAPLTSIPVSGLTVTDGGEAPDLGDGRGSYDDGRHRALAYLETAVREALDGAGIPGPCVPEPERTALVLGSSLAASAGSSSFWETYIGEGPEAADYAALRSYDIEIFLDALAENFDVRADAILVSNACAAGASSIALAADLIRSGRADFVIAAGYDTLELHTFAGFQALGALSPEPLYPFSRHRQGMKLSDGFGVLLLERAATAALAGRHPLAEFLGYGESADAHNLTQPHPEGAGAALAMERALKQAELHPATIDFLNLHATATPSNDLAEYRALKRVFGSHLRTLPLHAAKPALGHSLGGAGAVEAVITLLAIRHQYLPPTLGVREREPEMGALQLTERGRPARIRFAMSNSFGFGGCNASLVFGAPGSEGAP